MKEEDPYRLSQDSAPPPPDPLAKMPTAARSAPGIDCLAGFIPPPLILLALSLFSPSADGWLQAWPLLSVAAGFFGLLIGMGIRDSSLKRLAHEPRPTMPFPSSPGKPDDPPAGSGQGTIASRISFSARMAPLTGCATGGCLIPLALFFLCAVAWNDTGGPLVWPIAGVFFGSIGLTAGWIVRQRALERALRNRHTAAGQDESAG